MASTSGGSQAPIKVTSILALHELDSRRGAERPHRSVRTAHGRHSSSRMWALSRIVDHEAGYAAGWLGAEGVGGSIAVKKVLHWVSDAVGMASMT